ncbi:MAG: LamG domain-containing protein [Bacteroidales bacterium]|jgi:hypothetical protein
MKKIYFFLILLLSFTAYSQEGPGWLPQRYKANFRDSVNVEGDINFNGPIRIEGVTVNSNAQEINILRGALVNAAELNRIIGLRAPVQTQIDSKANTNSPTFTGTVTLPTTTSIGNISQYEISYLDNARRNIQQQLDDTIAVDHLLEDVFVGINHQTGTSYTLALTDNNKLITLSNTDAITLTVPASSSVAFEVGASITIAGINTGDVTVSEAQGVTVNSAYGALKLRARYSTATLIKIDTDTWLLLGDITQGSSSLQNGLVAYWPFDETAGLTAYDSTSNNFDLTIAGATINQVGSGDGKRSYSFDGVDDYVGNIDTLEFTMPFTISLMMRTSSTTGYQSPLGNFHWTGQGYDFIRNQTTGRIEFTIRNSVSGSTYVRSTTNVADNSWHHIAATWDGANIRIFVDGGQEAFSECNYAPNYHNSNRFIIGTREIGDNYFEGGIDNVAIYNRALTAGEISQLTNKYGNPF